MGLPGTKMLFLPLHRFDYELEEFYNIQNISLSTDNSRYDAAVKRSVQIIINIKNIP